MKKSVLAASVIAVCLLSNAMAFEGFKEHSLGVKAGTLGAGLEYATPVMKDLDLRMGINGFSYGHSDTVDNINYNVDLNLMSVSLLADYHPFSNGFIMSAGVLYNGNEVKYAGKATGGTYDINGVIYSATDVGSLDGKVDFNSFAPYIGIGYSTVTKSKGWHFTADLGAMYQGSPNASLNATCGSTLTPAQCTTLKANVEAERKDFEKDIDYEWYPVITLGVHYKF